MRDIAALLGSIAALAGAIAILHLVPGINHTTVGFALLLIVLSAATLAPLWVAVTASAMAMLALNFFFVPPVGTFTIADPQNLVSLVAFLVAAIVGSNLSAASKERARIAVERAELLQAREAAEVQRQRGELASTLLASLSHDLKTPLTAIRVAVEHLGGDPPAAERRAQADAAIAELLRLSRLFEDLLDMARIDAAALQQQREWVTAADVVDAALAHVRHAVGGRAVRVDAGSGEMAHIDARLASVALAHLLENAARYSPADREILVEAHVDRHGLRAAVSDHGPGLDPAEIDRLFERFYRGRGAQRLSPGTGMGLAIARGLLTAMGGHVAAENVEGGGARFSLSIPGATRSLAVEV